MIESFNTVLFSVSLGSKSLVITPWTLFGLVGNLLFTSRVLLQWLVSEKKKESVVPVAFWWLSLSGALVLTVYAYARKEVPFILGYAVTLAPYIRNLVIHYRPDRPSRPLGPIISIAAVLGCIPVWVYAHKQTLIDGWFYLGLAGNAIFMSRFFVQWVHSEAKRRSVMPLSFWYISLVGSVMLLAYSLIRIDLVFILGFVFNAIPYVRNIMLIKRSQRLAVESCASAPSGANS